MTDYTRTLLKASVANMVSGEIPDTNLSEICDRAVRDVLSRVDLRSSIRSTDLVPRMIREQYEYQCPSDMKGYKIIDVKPQIGRGKYYTWSWVTAEEFDRNKADMLYDLLGDPKKEIYYGERNSGLIAFNENDMLRKLMISKIGDNENVTISTMEDSDEWEAYGDTDTVDLDSDNYVTGDASLRWDINADGGTTAGVYSDEIEFDIEDYVNNGQIFVWAYIPDTDDLTNFILRIGKDSSNYYGITVTTNNEGNTFNTGWNLLRFNMADKTTTGTIADYDMEYVALFITKDAGKVSESGYLFNRLQIGLGSYHKVVYYSKYLWKSNTGTRKENSTADTDILIADADEIRLIEQRCAYLGEKYLKNHNEAKLWEVSYAEAENGYQLFHTSQALTMTNTYYEYGNLQ